MPGFGDVKRTYCIAVLLALCANPTLAWQPVVEADYGNALFAFYQERYHDAALSLQVAQQQGHLVRHADEAQLLLGGIYLSYGMHDEAENIFQQLIRGRVDSTLQGRAWLALAKLRYQRGLLKEAETALGRIEGPLPAPWDVDQIRLQTDILLATKRFRKAVQTLRPLAVKGDPFDRYNYAAALLLAGATPDGLAWLDDLGRSDAADNTASALRDQANISLEALYRKSGRLSEAEVVLQRVTLQGPFSVTALSELGRVRAQRNNLSGALVPWTRLTERPAYSLEVQAAWLMRADALERLGLFQQALDGYQAALAVYQREQDRIRATRDQLAGTTWLDPLLAGTPGDGAMAWLPELQASHDFHQAIDGMRTLQALATRLHTWRQDISSLRFMLSERREAYQIALTKLAAASPATTLETLRVQYTNTTQQLATIVNSEDIFALADERQREVIDRLQRTRERLSRLPAEALPENVTQRYRLLQGLLSWDLSQSYKPRLWEVRKESQAVKRELERAQAQWEQVKQVQDMTPERFEAYQARLETLEQQLDRLSNRTEYQQVDRRDQLRQLLLQGLAQREKQLRDFADRADYAQTRLRDQLASTPASKGTP